MDFETLRRLRETNAGLRLIRMDLMPFAASFFWKVFPATTRRQVDEETILAALEDHIFAIGTSEAVRPARDYLKSWVDAGYLRQFYVASDDLPRYELTPGVDKALDWLQSLKGRGFVGTESRLKTIFDVLRALMEGTETNRERRLALLDAQRRKLDHEIEQVRAGQVPVLSSTQVKERFSQLEELGRQLLRDFSEVEQNFRDLDRAAREKVTRLDGSRGEVLQAVFADADAIYESEQGKSFAAFFEFLMSPERLGAWDDMVDKLYELEPIRDMKADLLVARLKAALLDASDKVMGTQGLLASQLRRFLDDLSRRESRRISRLMREIETKLLALRDRGDTETLVTELAETFVTVDIPARGLYRIPLKVSSRQGLAEADGRTVAPEALFKHDYIDERVLLTNIRRCLEDHSPVSLAEVVRRFPVERGVSEIVVYLKLASRNRRAVIDAEVEETIVIKRPDGLRQVTLPRVLFSRGETT